MTIPDGEDGADAFEAFEALVVKLWFDQSGVVSSDKTTETTKKSSTKIIFITAIIQNQVYHGIHQKPCQI